MARGKLFYFTKDAERQLSDPDVLGLSWPAKGVLDVVECVLWSKTDTKGAFLRNGTVLDRAGILKLLRTFQGAGSERHLRNGLDEIIEAGILQKQDGVYVCPRVVDEHEAIERARKAGKASASRRNDPSEQAVATPRSNTPFEAYNRREEKRKGDGEQLGTGTPIDELPEFVQ